MTTTLRAAIDYFAGIFALGCVLGTTRVLMIAPATGDWIAVATELAFMLPTSWIYCGWLIERFEVPATMHERLLMSSAALCLLLTAEVVLGVTVFDRTVLQQLRSMVIGPGLVGLLGQLGFAAIPLGRRM